MTVFTSVTVFFPAGRLEELFHTYLDRYTADITDGVTLDGVEVTQTPVESDTQLAAIFLNNAEKQQFRKASIPNLSLIPAEVYDPPLDDDGETEGHILTGHTIRCGWPQLFLDHVANPPPGDEALFSGVAIVP